MRYSRTCCLFSAIFYVFQGRHIKESDWSELMFALHKMWIRRLDNPHLQPLAVSVLNRIPQTAAVLYMNLLFVLSAARQRRIRESMYRPERKEAVDEMCIVYWVGFLLCCFTWANPQHLTRESLSKSEGFCTNLQGVQKGFSSGIFWFSWNHLFLMNLFETNCRPKLFAKKNAEESARQKFCKAVRIREYGVFELICK